MAFGQGCTNFCSPVYVLRKKVIRFCDVFFFVQQCVLFPRQTTRHSWFHHHECVLMKPNRQLLVPLFLCYPSFLKFLSKKQVLFPGLMKHVALVSFTRRTEGFSYPTSLTLQCKQRTQRDRLIPPKPMHYFTRVRCRAWSTRSFSKPTRDEKTKPVLFFFSFHIRTHNPFHLRHSPCSEAQRAKDQT